MAVAPAPGVARTASRRGRPDMVTIRRTTLIAGLLEGMSIAQDAMTAAERIQTAAAIGSRQLVVQEAGRLGYRATQANAELRRLIADVEEPL